MNLKKYLPVENYTLTSNLSRSEIKSRLENAIEDKKKRFFSFSNSNSAKPYEGQLNDDSFVISRVINYRNSFLPVISGQISHQGESVTIKIKMRPTLFVRIFISFWLGCVGIVCLLLLIAGLLSFQRIITTGFSPFVFIPFGMFIFGFLLTYFAFKTESRNSKLFLFELLDGQ